MDKTVIWTFANEPTSIKDMVLDPITKVKLEKTLTEMPNLLLYGPPGVGKGTFTNIFLQKTGVDFIKINASDENSIDNVRTKIKSFATALGFAGKKKYVVLNEADALSQNSQWALRDLIESVQSISRFIFMCNYSQKIIPEIMSRCQCINLNNPPPKDIFMFLTNVLKKEKIVLESKEDLVSLIKNYYPDIRRMVNTMQMSVTNGKIKHITMDNANTIFDEIIKYMLDSDLDGIRKCLRSNMIMYPELYQYLFDNVDKFKSPGDAIIEIGNALYRDAIVAIREINFITMVAKMLRGGMI